MGPPWLLALLGLLWLPLPTLADAAFAGSGSCASCHEEIHDSWQQSHHALAMQPATAATVLPPFDDASLSFLGRQWQLQHDAESDAFHVTTDDATGGSFQGRISHTFGVYPLQQYLVAAEDAAGNALQVLPIAWDARSAAAGGQRWFHVFAADRPQPGDPLHWQSRNQGWNRMCAECHVTGWRKGYDPDQRGYQSQWTEVGVGCEGCHGPAAAHVASARGGEQPPAATPNQLGSSHHWTLEPGQTTARLAANHGADDGVCAPCHARRSRFDDTPAHAGAFLDHFAPQLPVPPAYFADGSIDDEVFEWGSFEQSRMRQAGVSCRDCHEPHSARLRAPGNALCSRCHAADHFDTPRHHHHASDSPAADCVACHAPTRTYMVVDDRHDHSFRIPRPDLAAAVGATDACRGCHEDQSPTALTRAWQQWWGETDDALHGGHALAHALQQEDPAAELLDLAEAAGQPEIIRAAALHHLASTAIDDGMAPRIVALTASPSALIRGAALDALQQSAPPWREQALASTLGDPVRLVRHAAAALWQTLPAPRRSQHAEAGNKALAEWRQAEQYNADWAGAQTNLAVMALREQDLPAASAHGHEALLLDPHFRPARLLLAELARGRGDETAAQTLLQAGLELDPDDADLAHALGLSLIRGGELERALPWLAHAAEAADNLHYRYVHAVAVHDSGDVAGGIDLMQAIHATEPNAVAPMAALMHWEAARGDRDAARRWQRRIEALSPER